MKVKDRNQSKPARRDAQHMTRGVIHTEISSKGTTIKVEPTPTDKSVARPHMELFLSTFTATVARLECKSEWNNGTGYFNGLVDDEQLQRQIPMGDRAAFVDEFGRKGLVLHSKCGLAVVFERYSGGEGVLVCNAADGYTPLQRKEVIDISSSVKLDTLRTLLLLTQLSA